MVGEPEFVTLRGDGLNLAAARWNGSEPVVICIHGMAGNCANWNTIVKSLTAEPHIIAIDLRGRGRSDKPASGYSVDHHRRDILAMMDTMLANIKNATLVNVAGANHYSIALKPYPDRDEAIKAFLGLGE